MKQRLWVDRTFPTDTAPDLYPGIIERVRGTPSRILERTEGLSTDQLITRVDDKWSIQEQVGHLVDLEPLWARRAQQILIGAAELAPADMSNRGTVLANHNRRIFAEITGEFFEERAELVRVLEAATDEEIVRGGWHPRLNQWMRLIDLAVFVAEHDDHHLATITARRAALAADPVLSLR